MLVLLSRCLSQGLAWATLSIADSGNKSTKLNLHLNPTADTIIAMAITTLLTYNVCEMYTYQMLAQQLT